MTTFEPEQLACIDEVDTFLRDPNRQVMRIDGPAGTGKTTLAQEFARLHRDLFRTSVLYGTLTGKAADVLNSKGCHGAQTLHSLAYTPKDKANDRLQALTSELNGLQKVFKSGPTPRMIDLMEQIDRERDDLSRPAFSVNWESELVGAGLLIVDERYMVDTQMGNDLMRFRTKLLLLGDQYQLGPVDGDSFMADTPAEFMLTELHRHALDSGIVEIATKARMREFIPPGDYGDAIVKARATDEDLYNADQIICGRNVTRRTLNWRMRDIRGIGRKSPPQPGEKLVCLRNNKFKGLKNGTMWEVIDAPTSSSEISQLLHLRSDAGYEVKTTAWKDVLTGNPPASTLYQERKGLDEFDYGDAITGHKSQGSQYNKVLVVDESKVFEEDEFKHRYTTYTRAAKELLVVRG